MAKKYDPDGSRTLDVVTKCDDAANAEECDLAEKARVRWAALQPTSVSHGFGVYHRFQHILTSYSLAGWDGARVRCPACAGLSLRGESLSE